MKTKETIDCDVIFLVEAGQLEHNAVLLANALKDNRNTNENLNFYAYCPRAELRPSSQVVKDLEDAGIRFQTLNFKNEYSKNGFYGKALSLAHHEKKSKASHMLFIDTDTYPIRSLFEIVSKMGDAHFTATGGGEDIGSDGSEGENENFWNSLYDEFKIEAAPPSIGAWPRGKKIRPYWNSGVFAYQRATCLGDCYRIVCKKLLDDDISHPSKGSFFMDQIALALAVSILKLKTKELPRVWNWHLSPGKMQASYLDESVADIAVLHYHNSLAPEYFQGSMKILEDNKLSDLASNLKACGPVGQKASSWLGRLRRLKHRLLNR